MKKNFRIAAAAAALFSVMMILCVLQDQAPALAPSNNITSSATLPRRASGLCRARRHAVIGGPFERFSRCFQTYHRIGLVETVDWNKVQAAYKMDKSAPTNLKVDGQKDFTTYTKYHFWYDSPSGGKVPGSS